MKKRVTCALLVVVLLLLSSCQDNQHEPISRTSFMLDTLVKVSIYDNQDEEILTNVMREIARLESLLSASKADSDIDRLNQHAGKDWVQISPECEEVLRLAKEVHIASKGYFDVTAGPLISLWNIKDGTGHYPSSEELSETLDLVHMEGLHIEEGRAYLENEAMRVHLGGIAKGYIADKVKELLIQEGVEVAIIDLGRNLSLMGEKMDGSSFLIGVQNPLLEDGFSKVLQVSDQSVVTAGIDERFFEYEGERYHHILNPFTGMPAQSGILSATIVTEQSALADALSTSCLLLGETEALQMVEGLDGVEVLLYTEDGRTVQSSGFAIYTDE